MQFEGPGEFVWCRWNVPSISATLEAERNQRQILGKVKGSDEVNASQGPEARCSDPRWGVRRMGRRRATHIRIYSSDDRKTANGGCGYGTA